MSFDPDLILEKFTRSRSDLKIELTVEDKSIKLYFQLKALIVVQYEDRFWNADLFIPKLVPIADPKMLADFVEPRAYWALAGTISKMRLRLAT